jgi:hypothetical protein
MTAVREDIRAAQFDPELSLAVTEQISAIAIDYIDWISQKVLDVYQAERDSWTRNRNSLRGDWRPHCGHGRWRSATPRPSPRGRVVYVRRWSDRSRPLRGCAQSPRRCPERRPSPLPSAAASLLRSLIPGYGMGWAPNAMQCSTARAVSSISSVTVRVKNRVRRRHQPTNSAHSVVSGGQSR